jgi:hypothetical protein
MAKRRPRLLKDTKQTAMLVAMTIRNAMEDFHIQHLSDAQMKELNPIIRNAVATALYALRNYGEDEACTKFVNFQTILFPPYWEEPQLNEEFKKFVKYLEEEHRANKQKTD